MIEQGRAPRHPRDHSIAVTDSSEEEGWLITYLDVMTLILVLCVVMLALAGGQIGRAGPATAGAAEQASAVAPGALSHEPIAAIAPIMAPAPAVAEPFADLDLDGLGDDIKVIMQESSISFRISSEILFSSGEALLYQGGYEVLDQLLPVLAQTGHRISISGHTDDLPIRTDQYPSNWELSSARAGSVVRYLQANGIAPARLTAIGHSDTRPLAANSSHQGRAQNRRVELTLEATAR